MARTFFELLESIFFKLATTDLLTLQWMHEPTVVNNFIPRNASSSSNALANYTRHPKPLAWVHVYHFSSFYVKTLKRLHCQLRFPAFEMRIGKRSQMLHLYSIPLCCSVPLSFYYHWSMFPSEKTKITDLSQEPAIVCSHNKIYLPQGHS